MTLPIDDQALDRTGPTRRLTYIETMRGIACILLVSFHVVGSTPNRGLELPPDHWLAILNTVFGHVRMPMFSFISGFVLSTVVATRQQWWGKTTSKARRLLVPMVCVSTLHFCFQSAFSHEPTRDWWQILVFPYDHFWFLQATFLLMTFSFTASLILKRHDIAQYAWMVSLAAAAAYSVTTVWSPNIFSSYNALYLAPYFFAGMAMRRVVSLTGEGGHLPRWLPTAILALAGGLIAYDLYLTNGHEQSFYFTRVYGIAVGFSVTIGLFLWRPENRLLAWIGGFSYAIYLFHVFFTAGTRIVVNRLMGELPLLMKFALSLGAGLIGPILLYAILVRNPVTSFLFLGIRKKKPQEKNEAAAPVPVDQSGAVIRP